MIRAQAVRAGYVDRDVGPHGERRRHCVLDRIDLEIRKGEAVAIVGANGSGKTTLLRVLAGLAEPWEGRVLVVGNDLATNEGRRAARREIGILFANPEGTIVAPTVEREIAFGLENRRWEREAMRQRVHDLLGQFSLEAVAGVSPLALSGGERARVALAAALAPRPACLFVDEAFALLDARHKATARAMVSEARHRGGMALVWATQDFDEVALADRVLVLEGGRITQEIPGRELIAHASDLSRIGLRSTSLVALRRALSRRGLDLGRSIDPAGMADHLAAWILDSS